MNRLRQLTTTAMLMLGTAACSSLPPADLSTASFTATGETQKHSALIMVTVAADAVSRRTYGSGSPNYQMPYALGDVDRRYARAVADAVFARATFDGAATGLPTLQLTSLSHNLIAHSSGSMPDVTDEVVARWTLFDVHGRQVAQYVFIGRLSAATGFGLRKKHFTMAQARGIAALQDLYQKTVAALANADELEQLLTQSP